MISEIAAEFGAQCCVCAIDAKQRPDGSGYEVYLHGGRTPTGIDAVRWAVEATQRGAGEVLLNSMDADGTEAGYDLPLIEAVRARVHVPIIASGGAGSLGDFVPAVAAGADALLAASVFHFGQLSIADVKRTLADADLPVR